MKTFNLTGIQSQAILDMRLARLNRLEVTALEKEYKEVTDQIAYLRSILESEKKLMSVIKSELTDVKKKYADVRRTEIIGESEAVLNIDESEFIVKEENAVVLTVSGMLKRIPLKIWQKGFDAADIEAAQLPKAMIKADSSDKLYVFTSAGFLYVFPVSNIPEAKIKEGGKLLNALINGVDSEEEILFISTLEGLINNTLYFATRDGFVKCVKGNEFDVKKSRIISSLLKDDDKLVCVEKNMQTVSDMLFVTDDGLALKVFKSEIPIMGRMAKGVASIKLNPGAKVLLATQPNSDKDYIITATDRGFAKKTTMTDIPAKSRNQKGQKIFKCDKHTGLKVGDAVLATDENTLVLKQGISVQRLPEDMINQLPKHGAPKQMFQTAQGAAVSKLEKSLI